MTSVEGWRIVFFKRSLGRVAVALGKACVGGKIQIAGVDDSGREQEAERDAENDLRHGR